MIVESTEISHALRSEDRTGQVARCSHPATCTERSIAVSFVHHACTRHAYNLGGFKYARASKSVTKDALRIHSADVSYPAVC